jgi:hypothetical protein
MIARRLIAGISAFLLLAAPACGADRKPLVIGSSGQQQQIQSGDTLSVPAAKVTGISGSTQCVQASSAGLLSGTGSACGGGSPGGSSGQIQYNNAGSFGGFTLGGDCTFSVPNITCTKTSGSSFATSATTDTTNAGNISSGVLGSNRGGAGAVSGILKANGSGVVSAASSGTDFAPATSGSSLLYANGSGGFSPVSIGSNLTFSGGTLSATGAGGSGSSNLSPFWDNGVLAISTPALGSFTLATSTGATATLTSMNSRGIVLNVSSSAAAVATATTAVLSQSAFTTSAFINPNWNSTGTTVLIALGIKDSTGKIDAFGERSSSGSAVSSHFTFTSALAVNTTANGTFVFMGGNSPHWLRIKLTGGNIISYISFDGENWLQLFSVAATSYLGSTLSSVGLVVENNATSFPIYVPIMSFNNTTP